MTNDNGEARARDAEVAEKVMGWESACCDLCGDQLIPPGGEMCKFVSVPAYSTDAAAAAVMEAEIERRGLREHYIHALIRELELGASIYPTAVECAEERADPYDVLWAFLRATPDQRCRAILTAIEDFNR
jgi:hypothetical protein